jgi:VWFA-related protein
VNASRPIVWLVTSAALTGVLTVHGRQQPVFSSRIDVVTVDVGVTRRGRPVTGLSADDFEVTDNGVKQDVTLVDIDELPLNVVLAVDLSSSLDGERRADLTAAADALLDALTPRDRAATVPFATAVGPSPALTSDFDLVRAALRQPPGGDRTSLVDAAFAGLLLGGSEVGRSLMLVFSDGVDTSSWLPTEVVLESARRADVVTYGVVSDDQRRGSFLRQLTSTTGGDVVEVTSTRDVREAFIRLLTEYRHRYLLSYRPKNVDRAGWHELDVRVSTRGVDVRARPGYLAGPG